MLLLIFCTQIFYEYNVNRILVEIFSLEKVRFISFISHHFFHFLNRFSVIFAACHDMEKYVLRVLNCTHDPGKNSNLGRVGIKEQIGSPNCTNIADDFSRNKKFHWIYILQQFPSFNFVVKACIQNSFFPPFIEHQLITRKSTFFSSRNKIDISNQVYIRAFYNTPIFNFRKIKYSITQSVFKSIFESNFQTLCQVRKKYINAYISKGYKSVKWLWKYRRQSILESQRQLPWHDKNENKKGHKESSTL